MAVPKKKVSSAKRFHFFNLKFKPIIPCFMCAKTKELHRYCQFPFRKKKYITCNSILIS
uniref:Ribosomal protein L32 n=1 Tax=Eukaryota sp. BB2 TaxID=1949062 RepID=A0A1W5QGV3_9EUKA|nr:ribosomal protein L32 [Eukaryota sp. BB2]AQL10477.1 ribosomal protein L32 [Eukaryota sp. BB2]